jgi:hypothetical protein
MFINRGRRRGPYSDYSEPRGLLEQFIAEWALTIFHSKKKMKKKIISLVIQGLRHDHKV